MAEEKLLTIRDVSMLLGISEKEVMDLAEKGAIPAYKIAGTYLRFKRNEIEVYRSKRHANASDNVSREEAYPLRDRISDFFYFNDFYILAGILIAIIVYFIFKG